jgi:hypothetical protein
MTPVHAGATGGDLPSAAPAIPAREAELESWGTLMARLGSRCDERPPPSARSSAQSSPLDPLASAAAAQVLAHWRGPASATPHLAAWLRDHVVCVALRTPAPTDWQWTLTCFAWAVHAAGADQPRDLRAAQRLGGITEITARQQPFSAWRAGRPGLPAGITIPGTKARTFRRFSEAPRPLRCGRWFGRHCVLVPPGRRSPLGRG